MQALSLTPVTTTTPYKAATRHSPPPSPPLLCQNLHHHSSPMADTDSPPPYQELEIQSQYHEGGGLSNSQVIALITLLPTGCTLLLLSGLIFAATMVGLAVAAVLFLIFSPVLVPAAAVVGLASTGFVASQTLVLTGVSALSFAWDYLRLVLESSPLRDVVDRMGKGHAQKDGPVHIVQFET